jgi:hypothetical protein
MLHSTPKIKFNVRLEVPSDADEDSCLMGYNTVCRLVYRYQCFTEAHCCHLQSNQRRLSGKDRENNRSSDTVQAGRVTCGTSKKIKR